MATRFNVATQSLDRVWVCFRPVTNLGANKASSAVIGYNRAASTTSNATMYDNIPRMNSEKYVPRYQIFKTPDPNALFQLSMNGSLYPQYSRRTPVVLPDVPTPGLLSPICSFASVRPYWPEPEGPGARWPVASGWARLYESTRARAVGRPAAGGRVHCAAICCSTARGRRPCGAGRQHKDCTRPAGTVSINLARRQEGGQEDATKKKYPPALALAPK
eukprot:scaffold5814_cov123-Isochrysis_galbana.AAC.12